MYVHVHVYNYIYTHVYTQGAKSYSVQVGNGHIDTSEMDITTYILLATGKDGPYFPIQIC